MSRLLFGNLVEILFNLNLFECFNLTSFVFKEENFNRMKMKKLGLRAEAVRTLCVVADAPEEKQRKIPQTARWNSKTAAEEAPKSETHVGLWKGKKKIFQVASVSRNRQQWNLTPALRAVRFGFFFASNLNVDVFFFKCTHCIEYSKNKKNKCTN